MGKYDMTKQEEELVNTKVNNILELQILTIDISQMQIEECKKRYLTYMLFQNNREVINDNK